MSRFWRDLGTGIEYWSGPTAVAQTVLATARLHTERGFAADSARRALVGPLSEGLQWRDPVGNSVCIAASERHWGSA